MTEILDIREGVQYEDPKPGDTKPTPPALVIPCYAVMYSRLCKIAREHGYALGLHGSMQRDLDLIAVPWVDEASDAETLVSVIDKAVHGFLDPDPKNASPGSKPHGRRCWTIHLGGGPYIDLSVMPRIVVTDATDIAVIRACCGKGGRQHYFETGQPLCMCGTERNTHCGLAGIPEKESIR